MNKSESIKNLAGALSKFQAEIQNPKNTADNPFFKSKYAPLNDILSLVRPLLTKNGLSVLQSPSGDGTNIIITTMLLHESGEWIEMDPLSLKADKTTAQGAGSAITYGRRYALSALVGISSEDDDDGNGVSGHKQDDKKQTSSPGAKPEQKPQTQTRSADPDAGDKELDKILEGQTVQNSLVKLLELQPQLGLKTEPEFVVKINAWIDRAARASKGAFEPFEIKSLSELGKVDAAIVSKLIESLTKTASQKRMGA